MCVYMYIFFFNFKYKISTDPEWQSSYYFCSLCMSFSYISHSSQIEEKKFEII